jgi:hypothetical protein
MTDERLREALAVVEEALARGRNGTLGPTGVNHALMVAERALRAALAATPETPTLDNLRLGEDGHYHCRGCDAHDIDGAER